MIIPNADAAFIDLRKLTEYSLNPEHHTGKHKAKVFADVLGITLDQVEILYNALLEVVRTQNTELGEKDEFGQRYVIDFEMTTENRSAIIRSAWIIREGEDFPRLTSVYVRSE